MMDEIEAFRVLIRQLVGQTPHHQVISQSKHLKSAIAKVVAPLGIGYRLKFLHCIDEQQPPCEWLVVKVIPNGQQTLFDDWLTQIEQDLETRREAVAALDLARAALNVLRRLAAIARMNPVQFHKILHDPDPQERLGIQLGVAQQRDRLVLRDPAGQDIAGDLVTLPNRVTLNESRQITCMVEFVGTHSALVRPARPTGGFEPKPTVLYWGQIGQARKISQALHRRAWNGHSLTLRVRDTLNKKSKLVRLEWVDADL
jgi:hypothetical protein